MTASTQAAVLTRADAQALRESFATIVDTYLSRGDAQHARAVAATAVTLGLWEHPLQRPVHFYPNISTGPVYAAEDFPVVDYLQEHCAAIRADVVRFMKDPGAMVPVEEQQLVANGAWDQLILYERGHRFDENCAALPAVAALLEQLPPEDMSAGVVMLSKLDPGTHIAPHCGHTNGRLRIHLGLLVPADTVMRVGETTVEWQEGQCLVFDDSYEHEVWHTGDKSRLVLIFDVFHPRLPDNERAALMASRADLGSRVRNFMRGANLQSIQRTPDGFEIHLDDEAMRRISRYFSAEDITAIRLLNDQVHIE